jgi:RNA polymerase sigma factor (sigma-70 family)
MVFRLISRFFRSREDVEDLAQDVFVKMFGRIDQVKPDENFPGWLQRVAVNTCYDELRKTRRRRIALETFGPHEVAERVVQPKEPEDFGKAPGFAGAGRQAEDSVDPEGSRGYVRRRDRSNDGHHSDKRESATVQGAKKTRSHSWGQKEMNSELNNFFKAERKRVYEPDPYFTQRVMARLASERPAPAGIWEIMPAAVRPVMALALTLLFAVLAVQILIPVEPARGAIEAYVGRDLMPQERMLYIPAQAPVTPAQFEELMLLEPVQ